MSIIATPQQINDAIASVAARNDNQAALSLTITTARRAMNDSTRAAARKALKDRGISWD